MYGQELHSKVISIDGIYSSIGTYIFDNLSAAHMLEVNITFLDPNTSSKLEADFEEDLKISREVKFEEWKRRSLWEKINHFLNYLIIRIYMRL